MSLNLRDLAKDIATTVQKNNCLYIQELPTAIFEELAILIYKENKDKLINLFERLDENPVVTDKNGGTISYEDNMICWEEFSVRKTIGHIFYYEGKEKFRVLDFSILPPLSEVKTKDEVIICLYREQTTAQDAFELITCFMNRLQTLFPSKT